MTKKKLTYELLKIDPSKESKRIEEWLKKSIFQDFKKKGAVIGLSGGIDSSVCAAICVDALGKENVLGIFTPEIECENETNNLGRLLADHLEIEAIYEDITPILDGAKCYSRRNDAIRMTIPQFMDNWRSKIVIPNALESRKFNVYSVVVQDEKGFEIKKRMGLRSYLQVVAASNFKQRSRKMIEYYHAERKNYAVIGTPNKLEYDLGFFVKYGDGSADIKPIAHLYKTQVYQLGKYYEIPDTILQRNPTTDTYSLSQSQEEFYFSLPCNQMDLALYSFENNYSEKQLARTLDIDIEVAVKIYHDIVKKKKIGNFLKMDPITL